jgi:hypothetical protein
MPKKLLTYWTIIWLLAAAGCGPGERMDPYPESLIPLGEQPYPPAILVGQILACVPVGFPRLSIWDKQTQYQQYRVTIGVENVLHGRIPRVNTEIYFLMNLRSQGRKPLGIVNYGGSWHIGDHEMFFLRRDSRRLRTTCDSFANDCVVPVLSGRHESAKILPKVGGTIADFLLTRGKGTSDAQMVLAMEDGAFRAFGFAPDYTVMKLEELVRTETPLVRLAACEHLRSTRAYLSYTNPDYANVLASNPDFVKATSSCPSDENTRR